MKYIITEEQCKLLTENEYKKILELPGLEVFGGWESLQLFLKNRNYPLYSIEGDLDRKSVV